MALTLEEQAKVRHHLGYPNVNPATMLQFGIPAPQQTLFLVESAMTRLLPDGENIVRRYVKVLDDIETKLVESQDRLAATQLDSLRLNAQEADLLEREYNRWANRLANVLAVPLYPFAQRFHTQGINTPVAHG